ncbi:MAG: aspartate aminotransferase family protein [SAR202 cluster bacterium]|nr:aspartate aminotransferase family protein [Chloroflexota bacterium]MQF95455.1 aspartate aminotransferase family protein [SAR202 cluster bacterium]MQG33730.1 aspartate aminotransferase family protein [SAR202 cluster bacterium]HCL25155.1 aspartate aminotransferase family protein [Dehalococcoidia bacterium]HCP24837.1 aspartate aminotransferase family protein [Dehalococcoidia bacterium]
MTQNFNEQELLELARKYSFRSRIDTNAVAGPIMVWGRGSVVRDVNGKEYLDFNSGQMCGALGHNHPRIVQALMESCETLIHSHMSMFNDREIVLAARLAEITPEGMDRSMFLTSGSDSNEAAMAIAKRFTGGYEFASPAVSFHGMNDSTRAVTFSGWHEGYGPYAPGHYPIMAPYEYRCTFCKDKGGCDYSCLNTSFELLDAQADGPLAGVITEPLFSAGGVIDLPQGWLKELKRKCEERGTLLIVDEAQTGLAKLGSMWGFDNEGVVPDIFTISKHFGGGVAISAAITTDEIEEKASQSGLVVGHSHSNDPMPCNAAIASLDIILEEALTDVAQRIGAYWRSHLERLAAKHEIIGDIRGRGLLQGIELVTDRGTREPAYDRGRAIGRMCLENGLIMSLRRRGSVFRFVPPFTTTEDQLDQAAEILDHAITNAV